MKANGEVTCGNEGVSHLSKLDHFGGERKIGGKKEKKEKEKKRGRKKRRSEKLQLLSRIDGDRTVGSHQSKRQSWSAQRELPVGTKISGFLQAPRGRSLCSYSISFFLKSHPNGMRCLGPRTAMRFSPKILGLNVGIF